MASTPELDFESSDEDDKLFEFEEQVFAPPTPPGPEEENTLSQESTFKPIIPSPIVQPTPVIKPSPVTAKSPIVLEPMKNISSPNLKSVIVITPPCRKTRRASEARKRISSTPTKHFIQKPSELFNRSKDNESLSKQSCSKSESNVSAGLKKSSSDVISPKKDDFKKFSTDSSKHEKSHVTEKISGSKKIDSMTEKTFSREPSTSTFKQPSHDEYIPKNYSHTGFKKRSPHLHFYYYKRTLAVLCITAGGFTLTNGHIAWSCDYFYERALVDKVLKMKVSKLIMADNYTKIKWKELSTSLHQFHPLKKIECCKFDQPIHNTGHCVYCQRIDCHRWVACVRMSIVLRHTLEPIDH